MKKRNKGFLFAYLLLLLLLSSAFPAAAEAEADVDYEHVPEEFKAFLEAFPEDLCALLPDGLFAEDAVSVGDAALSLGNFSGLLRALLSLLGARLPEAAALLATVAGLLILSAVFRALQNAVGSGGIGRAFSFCSTVAVLAALLGEGYVCVRTVTEYFTTLNGVCAASLPLSATLYAMGGNTATAAASSAALTVYMTVMEELIGKTIVPFCGICLSFSLVGAMDSSVRIGTLLSTIKKNYTTALTFLMMLLLAMLASQTLLAAKSDTLMMRSAKFAAGNLFPVVGGSVSELLRTVSSGVGYLRGTIGICATLLLLLLLFPVLIELFLFRLVYQLCASLADLLGCECEKKLLEEFASVNGYLVTAVAICSSVLLLSLSLLTSVASAIG